MLLSTNVDNAFIAMLSTPSILTVSQLNQRVRQFLEYEVSTVWVEGEVSNLSKPTSGHYYFTLKDKNAQLRCVYFRHNHNKITANLTVGQQLLARGKVSLYEARGDYQLLVEEIQEKGQGDLYYQFEQLKKKLAALGLFDSEKKRALPLFPTTIGIITSPTGAALHDILTTLKRRYPLALVRIYPCEVQGKSAAMQLIQALKKANQDKKEDVIILARGGGSIEDLWAFNDEKLAYCIAESTIPVITGIGHETDFTLADFVADKRAPTPTAAAEAATPDQHELKERMSALIRQNHLAIKRYLAQQQWLLQHQCRILSSPRALIDKYWQTVDYLKRQLQAQLPQQLVLKRHTLHLLETRLAAQHPRAILRQNHQTIERLFTQLLTNYTARLQAHRQHLSTILATLHAVSPLATLERGYTITTVNQRIVHHITQVDKGDTITTRLAKGYLVSLITAKGE